MTARVPESDQRSFEVDDLFELESMGMYYGGPYAWSADATMLAFTRVRAKKTLANHKWEFLWGNAGADVWVQTDPDGEPENVTNGIADGSGWWSPQWSPDGRQLAMLSTRGGTVRIWLWTRASRDLRPITDRGVDTEDPHERPYLWIDDERLLYPAVAAGQLPLGMRVELDTPMIATREWPKVATGQEVSVSVVESGVDVDVSQLQQGELRVVDLRDGSESVVARGTTRSWHLSPNGKVVAFTRVVKPFTPAAGQKLRFGSFEVLTVDFATVDGTSLRFDGELSQDVVVGSVRWSPGGDEAAFLGYGQERDTPPHLYRVDVPGRRVEVRPLGSIDAAPRVRESPQLEWAAGGGLIVLAAKTPPDAEVDVTTRRDWWLVEESGPPALLTGDIESPPTMLWPQERRHAFFGVANADLWRIEPATGAMSKLTEDLDADIHLLSWPAMTNAGIDQYRLPEREYTQAIVSVQDDGEVDYHLVDLRTSAIRPIAKPAAARLVAYEPRIGSALFYASDRNGLRIWRSDLHTDTHSPLFEANGFLAGIAEGEFRKLDYTSLNGDPLTAWLLLPVGYQDGSRYPLLTSVYPGLVLGDGSSEFLGTINSAGCLNMQLPAANGYAVLFPSMPLQPEGVADDPMLRLPEGVLPAVDKAIACGVADPKRLYLMGQSFGGFATYGLVTQTRRFHAAIALAGLSNLISLYGQFEARSRYGDRPQDDLFTQALMESGQTAMGGPPWTDLGRYIRNSPVFCVDRVETPLMIVQGDLDYIAIQQGEEFFSSLYRLGKRSSFVRYWGEGHVLESPANIRDFWQRVFDWLETFPSPPDDHADSE